LLQIVPYRLGMFLKQNVIDKLTLCGNTGKSQNVDVFLQNDEHYTTMIGLKWNEFCIGNNFRAAFTYRFKFSTTNLSVCHVFRDAPFSYEEMTYE